MSKYFAKNVDGKLSLCSRDIDTLDKMYSEDTSGKVTIVEYGECRGYSEKDDSYTFLTEDGDMVSSKKEYCHKVIGEISKDATWVKEGDEFSEEEVRNYVHLYDRYTEGSDFYFRIDTPIVVKNPENITLQRIEVKGSCGHFH